MIIDDTSLSRVKDMTTLIYQVAEGYDRDRLNNKAEMQEVAEWATSIFFTGEKTILFSGNNQLKGKAGRLGRWIYITEGSVRFIFRYW